MVAGRRRNFCLLCEKGKTSSTFAVRRLDAPLAPPAERKFTPIRGSWPKRSSAPLSAFEGSSERKDHRLFAINGEDLVSRNSRGITNLTVHLHCSGHHNLNVSIHLFTSLRVSSNQLFMFCINNNAFSSTLF